MLIRVIKFDKSTCIVDRLTLNKLLDRNEVAANHDSKGWVARHDDRELTPYRPGRMSHHPGIVLQAAVGI